jgi:protein-S-isoprenylcysteine O-methyltransferase Ste14
VASATLLFAVIHSVLATDWIKRRVELLLGRRARNGLYRFAYNNITYASIGAILLASSRLPDRVVYRVPRPWSLLMGVGRFTGMSGAWEFISGGEPRREPPAQGPRLEHDVAHATGGAFRFSRHPNNLGPTLVVCLQPTMGVRLLTFAVAGGLYSFFGSMLEERRVRAAYKQAYDVYREHTPFFFPLPIQSRGRL